MQYSGLLAAAMSALVLVTPGLTAAQSGDALPAPHARDRLVPASAPSHLSDWKRKPVWHLLAACDFYFRMHAAQDDFFGGGADSAGLRRANEMSDASVSRLIADRGVSREAALALHTRAVAYFNHDEDLYGEVEPTVERRCQAGLALTTR